VLALRRFKIVGTPLPQYDVFSWTNIIITIKYSCCFCTTEWRKLGSYILIDDFSRNLIVVGPSCLSEIYWSAESNTMCTVHRLQTTRQNIEYVYSHTELTTNGLRQISSVIGIRIGSTSTKYAFARTVPKIVDRLTG